MTTETDWYGFIPRDQAPVFDIGKPQLGYWSALVDRREHDCHA